MRKSVHAAVCGRKKVWLILKQWIKRLKALLFTLSVSFELDRYAASEPSASFRNLFCKVARECRRSVAKEYIIRGASLKSFTFSRRLDYRD
jgi:hypothetical protein